MRRDEETRTPVAPKLRMTVGRAIFSIGLFGAILATGFAATITFRAAMDQRGQWDPGTDHIAGDSLHG